MSPRQQISDDGIVRVYEVTDGQGVKIGSDAEPSPGSSVANAALREGNILGAKARARQIRALTQTPAARTATAWTQPQRVAILDAIGDMATMLSWLADQMLAVPEPPD